MDLTDVNGERVVVAAAEQTDEVITAALNELLGEMAARRGLWVPTLAGTTAVEASVTSGALGATAETGGYPTGQRSYDLLNGLKETLRGQLGRAYTGYDETIGIINESTGHMLPNAIERADFEQELEAWLTPGRLDLLLEMLVKNPGLDYTLIGTPNVYIGSRTLITMMHAFENGQDVPADINEYMLHHFSAPQLSGTNPDDGKHVHFSVIFSHSINGEMFAGAHKQRVRLAGLAGQYPGAHLKIPSLLDAVTYWNTLRPQGAALDSESVPDVEQRTAIVHFNVPAGPYELDEPVPCSIVKENGEIQVRYVYDNFATGASIAIG